jgi:uncharacterized membrane-anchored protein YhcB (DUF1043 family)
MSNKQKLFLRLAVIFSLISIVLGFLVINQKRQVEIQIAKVEEALESQADLGFKRGQKQDPVNKVAEATKLLRTTSDILKQTQETLSSSQAELLTTKAKVESLTDNLATTNKNLEDTKIQLGASDTQLAETKAKLKEFEDALGGRDPRVVMEQYDAREEEFRILNAEKRIVEDSLAQRTAELNRMRELEDLREQKRAPLEMGGKVLAINTNWNFVVLDVGTASRLVEGVDLTVYRGSNVVGKVRTVAVEQETAIADILPDWMQTEIQIGDQVLF